eukprot:m.1635785 g.1635785  ORF g.1635785 m.1635785 type:complete len:902 (-) comp25422_c0_seq11:7842-10547(-)
MHALNPATGRPPGSPRRKWKRVDSEPSIHNLPSGLPFHAESAPPRSSTLAKSCSASTLDTVPRGIEGTLSTSHVEGVFWNNVPKIDQLRDEEESNVSGLPEKSMELKNSSLRSPDNHVLESNALFDASDVDVAHSAAPLKCAASGGRDPTPASIDTLLQSAERLISRAEQSQEQSRMNLTYPPETSVGTATGVLHRRRHPYECPVCRKGFTLADSLRIHSLMHGGERTMNALPPTPTSPSSPRASAEWPAHASATPPPRRCSLGASFQTSEMKQTVSRESGHTQGEAVLDANDVLALARACPQIVVTNNSPGADRIGTPPAPTDGKKPRPRPPPLPMARTGSGGGPGTDDDADSRCSSVYFDASEGAAEDALVRLGEGTPAVPAAVDNGSPTGSGAGRGGVALQTHTARTTPPPVATGVVAHRSPLDSTITAAVNVLADARGCDKKSSQEPAGSPSLASPVECTSAIEHAAKPAHARAGSGHPASPRRTWDTTARLRHSTIRALQESPISKFSPQAFLDRQPTVTSPTPRRKGSRPRSLVLPGDATDTPPARGGGGASTKDFVALNRRKASDPGPRTRTMAAAAAAAVAGGRDSHGAGSPRRADDDGACVASLCAPRKSPSRLHKGSGPARTAKDSAGKHRAGKGGAGSGAGKNRRGATTHAAKPRTATMGARANVPPGTPPPTTETSGDSSMNPPPLVDITAAAAAACAAADAIKEIVHRRQGTVTPDDRTPDVANQTPDVAKSVRSPGSPKRQLPKAPLVGASTRRSSAIGEQDQTLPTSPPRRASGMAAGGQRPAGTRRTRGEEQPSATTTTADAVSTAAQAMRRDFRVWLAWRKADQELADTEAARMKIPGADSDPASFRATAVGTVASRQTQESQQAQLAKSGVVWMQDDVYSSQK